MKVRDLSEKLNNFDPEMEIWVTFDSKTEPLDRVEPCMDMDTNEVYLSLANKHKR